MSRRAFFGTIGIQLNVIEPLHRNVVLIKDRFHRALGNARFAINALVWININHLGVLIEAFGWENFQARFVLAAFTRFSHDHRHNYDSPDRIVENRVGTYGGENLDEKADIELQKSSNSILTNLASRDLIEIWRAGSQDAANVLWARYQVRLVALD